MTINRLKQKGKKGLFFEILYIYTYIYLFIYLFILI